MSTFRTSLTGGIAAAALAGIALTGPIAAADPGTSDEPCAKQAAKVEKAENALARVSANFERQQAKVKKAKGEVKKAEKRAEKAAAREQLREAKEKKGKVAEAKRAQKQRVAKATERYDVCVAESETEETPAP